MWWLLLTALAVTDGRYEKVNVKLDWWQHAVVYQIYVRSFSDSDGNGVGDINGVTSRIEYLKEIGVDAIRLTPIFKSPMRDSGYDVSDYYSIQPELGSIGDFEQLLKKASNHNVKVILEIQLNHSSNESEWFVKSASRDEYYSDWYVWEHGHLDSSGVKHPPNNWISVFGKSAWTFAPSRDQFYLHQFDQHQPDLNFRNPVVIDEIKNIIKFWLERGIAGMVLNTVNHYFEVDKDIYGGSFPNEPVTGKPTVRTDEYQYLDHVYTKDQDETYDLVSQIRDVFDAISLRDNLTRVLITEASATDIKNAVKYYGCGRRLGAHIPVNTVFIDHLSKDSDARDLKYALDKWLTYKPLKSPANWMMGNHDQSRVASRFRSELIDAFNMLVLLLPGTGMTYMGEEIGMANGFVPWKHTKDPLACGTDDPVNYVHVSRDPQRTPMQWNSGKNAGFSTSDEPWLPAAEGHESLNVANQQSAVRSHYQVYKALNSLRSRPAFKLGRFESLALNSDVFAFKRWYNDDSYVIVMNTGRTYRVVNLTAFDLVFGQLEVEVSSVLSSRVAGDTLQANYLDLAAGEALVLRMQV